MHKIVVCVCVLLFANASLVADTPPETASPRSQTQPDSVQKPVGSGLDNTRPDTTDPDPGTPPADWVTPAGDSTLVFEPFDYPKHIGSFPEDVWEGRSGWRYSKTPKHKVYYQIVKEGANFYLNAKTQGEAVNFGREARINLRLHQKLRWRWRVHNLPTGADETDDGKNDSAAAVRIIIGTNPLSAKAIKYVWSASLKPGTEIDSGRLKVVVLEGGPEKLGQWVWEEVNVYEDYRRLFGGDPRPMDILGILTDSDNTKELVEADYDDITFIVPRPDTVEMVPDFMLQDQ